MTSDGTTYGKVIDHIVLKELGLSITIVRGAIQYTHETFDRIDNTLVQAGNDRLAALIELANLSAIVGNFFRRGISTASNGAFMANRPHTFPDLLAMSPGSSDLEIKVALEDNNPKGPTASKLAKLYESKTAQFGCSRDCP